MSIRALTRFLTLDGSVACTTLTMPNGSPSKYGKNLVRFCRQVEIIRNSNPDAELGYEANGIECLAAQIVAVSKKRVGGVLLVPEDFSTENVDYVYTVHLTAATLDIHIAILDVYNNVDICSDLAKDIDIEFLLEGDDS